jgi:hypothetical protein
MMEDHTGKECAITLLEDNPALEDELGSHESLARTLASFVRDQVGGKSVALLGGWGSGKSTIVHRLKDILEDGRTSNYRVVVFDAWCHEGDPLRRAFLETVIDFGVAAGWLGEREAHWRSVRARLSGLRDRVDTESSSRISHYGRALVLATLAVPIGLALMPRVQNPSLLHWLGASILSVAPLLTLIALTWFRKADLNEIDHACLPSDCSSDDEPQKEDLFTLLLRNTSTKTRQITSRDVQPTSLEFQKHWADLLADLLAPEGRRLVVVVDNLDRVNPDEAVRLWSTMRTFMSPDQVGAGECLRRFWLVVPIDADVLDSLWAREKDGVGGLAGAFVEKTFQAVLVVPEARLSAWQGYLTKRLGEALPHHDPLDFHSVYQVYRRSLPASATPTPRDIKVFVNRLATVHAVWGHRISLPRQALYTVIEKRNIPIDDFLFDRVDSLRVDQFREIVQAEGLLADLAAIALNVEPQLAMQSILGPEVADALTGGDAERTQRLSEFEGFGLVCEDVVYRSIADWIADYSTFASVVLAMPNPRDSAETAAWRMLHEHALAGSMWTGDVKRSFEAIARLCESDPVRFETWSWVAWSANLQRLLSEGSPNDEVEFSSDDDLLHWIECAAALQALWADRSIQGLCLVDVPAPLFLDLAVRCTTLTAGDPFTLVEPGQGFADIGKEINARIRAGALPQMPYAVLAGAVRRLSQPEVDETFMEIAGRISSTPELDPIEATALFGALLALCRDTGDWSPVESRSVLLEPYWADQWPMEVRSTAFALWLALGLPTPEGDADSETAQAGRTRLEEWLAAPHQDLPLARETASRVHTAKLVRELADRLSNHATGAAARQVFAVLPEVVTLSEYLSAEEFTEKYSLISWRATAPVVARFTASYQAESLGQAAVNTDTDLSRSSLYSALIPQASEGTRRELVDRVVGHLRDMKQQQWSDVLAKSDVGGLLSTLRSANEPIGAGLALKDALLDYATNVLKNSVAALRYEQLEPFLHALEEDMLENLLADIRDLACSVTTKAAGLTGVFESFGPALLQSDVLLTRSDDVIRKLLPQILRREKMVEYKWAVQMLQSRPDVVERAKRASVTELRQRVDTAVEGLAARKRLGLVAREMQAILN